MTDSSASPVLVSPIQKSPTVIDPDSHETTLMPAAQTLRNLPSNSPDSYRSVFFERSSSRLGPPPEKLLQYKVKPRPDPFACTYMEHPQVGEHVLRVTHANEPDSTSTELDRILARMSFESGSSSSTKGHIPIYLSPKSRELVHVPSLSPSSRNPFKAWMHILMYAFSPIQGYQVVQYPQTGVLVVRNNIRHEKNGTEWDENVELFVMRCYTEAMARRKLKERKKLGSLVERDYVRSFTMRNSWASDEAEKRVQSRQGHNSWGSDSTDSGCSSNSLRNSWAEDEEVQRDKRNSWANDTLSDKEAAHRNSRLWRSSPENRVSRETKLFKPGERWLGAYLHSLRTGKGWDPRDGKRCPAAKIWGAVAVGRKVKFMELVGGTGAMKDLPPVLVDISFTGLCHDLSAKRDWDLERDCKPIDEILMLIDMEHWG